MKGLVQKLGTGTVTRSAAETRKLGARIGRMMRGGGVVGLTGDLGAGKTVMAAGLFNGAGMSREARVTSPTFTLVNVYPGPIELYHVDLFRLESPAEVMDAGITELWENGGALVVVEWFEKFPELRPESFLDVRIQILKGRERRIAFSFHGR
jgi:tRNA threonylcarbamoyladenosine biosynthesis protein TsaE